jgi:hypothetical protein
MSEGGPANEEDALEELADQLRTMPPWTPDPVWFARLKERLLTYEPAAEEPG